MFLQSASEQVSGKEGEESGLHSVEKAAPCLQELTEGE